jgi:glutamate synthase (NADPH/NADH) large chain
LPSSATSRPIGKGLLKVMSKMGISTYQSYCGAQIFDAVGLSPGFRRQFFTGTATHDRRRRPEEVARETVERHRLAFSDDPVLRNHRWTWAANMPSACAARSHVWTPEIVADLQHAVRGNVPEKYRRIRPQVNDDDG